MIDAAVVGSGPNGLSAAIELARKGHSVTVYEANDTIGGGCRSAEMTLPGFVHDVCSAFHPLGAASPFFRELDLSREGLEWIEPPAALAHPLDDGTAVLLERSIDATAANLGPDARAYRRLVAPLVPEWDHLAADALGPLIRIPRHPFVMARLGLPGVLPARALARIAFSGVRARALFAGLAAHSVLPLDAPLTASFGLMFAVATHDEIADSEAQIARGVPAERPFILVGQQSLFDPSRAPAGKHTVWAYCHIPNGSTFDMTERVEAQIERFAPGFRDRVLARSVMGP